MTRKIHIHKICLLVSILLLANTWAFSQNECSTAGTLTSSTACNNTNINLNNATASSSIPLGCWAAGTYTDNWYQFTAVSTTHTVTLSNLGTRFTNPRIQIYSGSCGSLTSVVCGNTSGTPVTATATGLTIGATYYIRVANLGAWGSNGNYRADICVTHPQPPPSNDDCSASTSLTPSATCTNTAGTLFYATATATATACGTGTFYDVWYNFTATSTTHAISLSSLGANLSAASTYIQVFSGTCGSLMNISCGAASSRLVITTLTAGTTYFIRIYTTTNPTILPSSAWNFNICVQAPQTNDAVCSAVTLTSGASCSNTAGNIDLATNSAPPAGCASGTNFDVWYTFTPSVSTTYTVNLSSLGANFNASRIQIYSGTCGSLTSVSCSVSPHTSLSQPLVSGTTYFIRISQNGTQVTTGSGGFNICITTSATAPPSNDGCSSPQVLTSSTTCNNVGGTLFNATASTIGQITNTCGGNQNAADVWYSFVAQTAYPNIIFRNIGIPVGGGSNRAAFQLLAANTLCTNSYTNLICNLYNNTGTDNTITTTALNGGAGLTVGQTYYIRIFYNQSGTPTNAWTFSLCIQDLTGAFARQTAKSYINVTKQNIGGSIDVNDVLEIRATFSLTGTNSVTHIDSISFQDTLKANAGFRYQTNTVAMRTNEGKIFGSAFPYTDAAGDDGGSAVGGGVGSDTIIRINFGTGATSSRGGSVTISSTSYPRTAAGNYLIMATYRVTVNRTYGTVINFGGGSFRYRNRTTGAFETVVFPRDSLIVYATPSICPNATSATNVIGDEFNGTFGSQTTGAMPSHNRNASTNTTYSFLNFTPSSPNDNYYGITSNTAAAGTIINKNQPIPESVANSRVFGVWDITGDHTGASDVNRGNPPCNTALPVDPVTNPCGYMMVVNSAYKMDTAFQFNVANVCPNTFYEVSAWLKNVCYKCGQDSAGRGQWSGSSYNPTGPNDTTGIRPNIAIKVNNLDYYSTGDILHQGAGVARLSTTADSANRWLFRAFVYRTDSVTNNFTLTFRNNAPGGGGNDWAIDDISFKTCSPTLQMTPSANSTFCNNNQVNMQVRVATYYDVYQYYQWERSTDGGNTWSAAPEMPAIQQFTYTTVSGEYRDTVTGPSIIASATTNGYRYRIRVATTIGGISNSCAVFNTDDVIVVTLASSGCNPLPNEVLKFNAQLNGEKTALTWTSIEEHLKGYEIERSDDGVRFKSIGYVIAKGSGGNEVSYLFNDPVSVSGKVYYRLKLDNFTGNNSYSNTLSVKLEQHAQLEISNLVNPFRERISFQLNAVRNEEVQLQITDALGKPLLNKKLQLTKGSNAIAFEVPLQLAKGSYLLRIISTSGNIHRIIQKQ